MFTPVELDLERGWPGRIDGDVVVQLAAQTLQSFFTGGSAAREHAEYSLDDVLLRAPCSSRRRAAVRRSGQLLLREPERDPLARRLITRPAGRLDVSTRLAAVIGLDGAIGGWTGLAEWRAPELAPPKDRDFALMLGPIVDTELTDDFDWEAARALAELNTRLRPGDLLGGPPLALHENVESGPLELTIDGSGRSPRTSLDSAPGVSSGHAFLPASRRRPAQAPHPVPRQRHPAHRGGDGARGLHGERVDPLPPPVALPGEGGREFEPIVREEWVPDTHAHRMMHTKGVEPGGDEVTGRRLLMWNADVEISLCRPTEQMDYFFRNGEGDEVIFVHEGTGTLETIFGELPYKDGDYVVIPRGTTYRFRPEGEQRYLVFETPGLIEIPRRYRNQYGQIIEGAPYYHRDIHPPTELNTHRDRGIPGQGARARRLPDLPPRLPPLRRRRLGRLSLPVDVLDPRFRADHRPDPPAAARRTRPSPGATS